MTSLLTTTLWDRCYSSHSIDEKQVKHTHTLWPLFPCFFSLPLHVHCVYSGLSYHLHAGLLQWPFNWSYHVHSYFLLSVLHNTWSMSWTNLTIPSFAYIDCCSWNMESQILNMDQKGHSKIAPCLDNFISLHVLWPYQPSFSSLNGIGYSCLQSLSAGSHLGLDDLLYTTSPFA